uniref:Retrotransposon gag domain-containing protein n=1 Tax=Cacopsylla melanoneura TaxID=428564 RepID=A0A8D9AQ33_9HEMI
MGITDPPAGTQKESKRLTYSSQLEKLNLAALNLPQEWERWSLNFKIFLLATGLNEESDTRKVSMLLHHMGPEAVQIFQSFKLELNTVKFDDLVKRFTDHFIPKKSLCILRHKFFTSKQGQMSITEYTTNLTLGCTNCSYIFSQ